MYAYVRTCMCNGFWYMCACVCWSCNTCMYMRVCTYIHMCVWIIRAHIHTYIHTYACMCMYTYVCVSMICMCMYVFVCLCVSNIHELINTLIHIMHSHIYGTCIHTYIHMYVYAHIRNINTNICTLMYSHAQDNTTSMLGTQCAYTYDMCS